MDQLPHRSCLKNELLHSNQSAVSPVHNRMPSSSTVAHNVTLVEPVTQNLSVVDAQQIVANWLLRLQQEGFVRAAVPSSSQISVGNTNGTDDGEMAVEVQEFLGEEEIIVVDGTNIDDTEKLDNNAAESSGKAAVSITLVSSDVVTRESRFPDIDIESMTYELQQGYRIFRQLLVDSNKSFVGPFLHPVDTTALGCSDYYQRIKQPICLKQMWEKFHNGIYKSITEFVGDMRLMLENCYRFNGPDHSISRKAQRLETLLEQKLALLSRELRDKTSLIATSGKQLAELQSSSRRQKQTQPAVGHSSTALLNELRREAAQREREARRQHMLEKRQTYEVFMQSLQAWEDSMLDEPIRSHLCAIWEIPEVCQFLQLCAVPLGISEISIYEFEMSFLMPRESSIFQRVMTSLLSTPHQRLRLDSRPLMPYRVWNERLKQVVRHWYKVLNADCRKNIAEACIKLAIEEKFFKVLGMTNPLNYRPFHELTLYQKVWLVKTLCDICLDSDNSLCEVIEQQPTGDQRAMVLGVDNDGYTYIHFPQFCGADLRIYKHRFNAKPKKQRGNNKRLSKRPCSSERNQKKQRLAVVTSRSLKGTSSGIHQSAIQGRRDSRLRQNPRQIKPSAGEQSDAGDNSATVMSENGDSWSSADSDLDTSVGNSSDIETDRSLTPVSSAVPIRPKSAPKQQLGNVATSNVDIAVVDSTATVLRRSLRKIIEESKKDASSYVARESIHLLRPPVVCHRNRRSADSSPLPAPDRRRSGSQKAFSVENSPQRPTKQGQSYQPGRRNGSEDHNVKILSSTRCLNIDSDKSSTSSFTDTDIKRINSVKERIVNTYCHTVADSDSSPEMELESDSVYPKTESKLCVEPEVKCKSNVMQQMEFGKNADDERLEREVVLADNAVNRDKNSSKGIDGRAESLSDKETDQVVGAIANDTKPAVLDKQIRDAVRMTDVNYSSYTSTVGGHESNGSITELTVDSVTSEETEKIMDVKSVVLKVGRNAVVSETSAVKFSSTGDGLVGDDDRVADDLENENQVLLHCSVAKNGEMKHDVTKSELRIDRKQENMEEERVSAAMVADTAAEVTCIGRTETDGESDTSVKLKESVCKTVFKKTADSDTSICDVEFERLKASAIEASCCDNVKNEVVKQEEEEDMGPEKEEPPELLAPDADEFQLVASSIETLRQLVSRFSHCKSLVEGHSSSAECSTSKANMRRCEAELYSRLTNLLTELEPYEQKLIQLNKKMKVKLRKEHESYREEPVDDKQQADSIWQNEDSVDEESSSSVVTTVNESSHASIVPPSTSDCDIGITLRSSLRRRPNNITSDVSNLSRKRTSDAPVIDCGVIASKQLKTSGNAVENIALSSRSSTGPTSSLSVQSCAAANSNSSFTATRPQRALLRVAQPNGTVCFLSVDNISDLSQLPVTSVVQQLMAMTNRKAAFTQAPTSLRLSVPQSMTRQNVPEVPQSVSSDNQRFPISSLLASLSPETVNKRHAVSPLNQGSVAAVTSEKSGSFMVACNATLSGDLCSNLDRTANAVPQHDQKLAVRDSSLVALVSAALSALTPGQIATLTDGLPVSANQLSSLADSVNVAPGQTLSTVNQPSQVSDGSESRISSKVFSRTSTLKDCNSDTRSSISHLAQVNVPTVSGLTTRFVIPANQLPMLLPTLTNQHQQQPLLTVQHPQLVALTPFNSSTSQAPAGQFTAPAGGMSEDSTAVGTSTPCKAILSPTLLQPAPIRNTSLLHPQQVLIPLTPLSKVPSFSKAMPLVGPERVPVARYSGNMTVRALLEGRGPMTDAGNISNSSSKLAVSSTSVAICPMTSVLSGHSAVPTSNCMTPGAASVARPQTMLPVYTIPVMPISPAKQTGMSNQVTSGLQLTSVAGNASTLPSSIQMVRLVSQNAKLVSSAIQTSTKLVPNAATAGSVVSSVAAQLVSVAAGTTAQSRGLVQMVPVTMSASQQMPAGGVVSSSVLSQLVSAGLDISTIRAFVPQSRLRGTPPGFKPNNTRTTTVVKAPIPAFPRLDEFGLVALKPGNTLPCSSAAASASMVTVSDGLMVRSFSTSSTTASGSQAIRNCLTTPNSSLPSTGSIVTSVVSATVRLPPASLLASNNSSSSGIAISGASMSRPARPVSAVRAASLTNPATLNAQNVILVQSSNGLIQLIQLPTATSSLSHLPRQTVNQSSLPRLLMNNSASTSSASCVLVPISASSQSGMRLVALPAARPAVLPSRVRFIQQQQPVKVVSSQAVNQVTVRHMSDGLMLIANSSPTATAAETNNGAAANSCAATIAVCQPILSSAENMSAENSSLVEAADLFLMAANLVEQGAPAESQSLPVTAPPPASINC